MSFDTLEELKVELAQYFPDSQKSIVEKLTTFSAQNPNDNGVVENHYKDFSTAHYAHA